MSERLLHYDALSDRLLLFCSPRDVDLAKQVPGFKYDGTRQCWQARASWPLALAARGVFGDSLAGSADAYAWAAPHAEQADAVERFKEADSAAQRLPVHEGLFDYQVTASVLMAYMRSFLLADEKGNGKTVEAIVALREADARVRLADGGARIAEHSPYPALVVATASMKLKWAAEFKKWAGPGAQAFVAGRTAGSRKKAIEAAQAVPVSTPCLLVVGWGAVTKHTRLAPYGNTTRTAEEASAKELNGGWVRSVIADEFHRAKDPKAKQTRAVWALMHEAEWRFGLTATPVTKSPRDLWSLMHGIAPTEWPSRSAYRDRYVSTVMNPWGGYEDRGFRQDTLPELNRFLNPRYLRRPLQAEVTVLPPDFRWVEMDPPQRKAYEQMRKNLVAEVTDGELLIASSSLAQNTRLIQLAAATPVLDEAGNVTSLEMPSCKVDALIDLLDEMHGEPLVVFAESRKLIELCQRELTRPRKGGSLLTAEQIGLITGSVSEQDRDRYINAFQAGELPLMLATIQAGGEGITLTRARIMTFLQRSYKHVAGNLQAEGRLIRHGQERPVQIIDIITKDTVEEKVHAACGGDEEMFQQLVNDPGWFRKALTGKEG